MQPGATESHKSQRTSRTPPIPLRPELIGFLNPQSLGLMSCASAALRRDVLDSKAWELVANAQKLRSAREAALAAERDAVARVKSQVRRRQLADSLSSQETPPFVPNKLADFTFFVRFEEDGDVIWEGDLGPSAAAFVGSRYCTSDVISLSMSEVWSGINGNYSDAMANFLSVLPSSSDDCDEDEYSYLARLRITLVAIRNTDQAMIPLGSFTFERVGRGRLYGPIDYLFYPRRALFKSEPLEFWIEVILRFDDSGQFDTLEICAEHHCFNGTGHEYNDGSYLQDICKKRISHLLTYLAGVPLQARDGALATMMSWHADIFPDVPATVAAHREVEAELYREAAAALGIIVTVH